MNITHKIIIILLFGCFLGGIVYSQPALHLRHLPQEIASQAYQPAYLAMMDSTRIQVGGAAAYGVGSNVLQMDHLFLEPGLLSESAKDGVVQQLGADNRLQLGFVWEGALNIRLKQMALSVFSRSVTQTHATFFDPQTVGLLLYGNARYAGQTITDEEISLGLTSYQEVGIGTAFQKGRLAAGIRLKALIGGQATVMQDLTYSLFTEAQGAQIILASDYTFFQSNADAGTSLGVGVDLGAVYTLSPNLSVQFAVQDLGFLTWNGDVYENNVNIDYEGVEITELFSTDFSNATNLIPSDTLRSLLIPDPVSGTVRQTLPGLASIGAAYRWQERNQLFATVLMGIAPNSFTNSPLLANLAYHRKLGSFLTLGVNAYGGGLDQYGFGALARADLRFSKKIRMSIFANMDNAIGVISPSNGKGFSFQGGLTLGWL